MKSFKNIHLAAILSLFVLASCSTDQAVFTSTDNFAERVDMVLEGEEKEFIYLQNDTGDASLIDFTLYGTPSRQVDIHVNIDAGRTLVFTLVDDIDGNPWMQEGGFSMFATAELEDKQRYVTARLETGSEMATHTTNLGDTFPRGTILNAFNILDFNPSGDELFCRIIDLPMISTTDGTILTISGTFRGTVE